MEIKITKGKAEFNTSEYGSDKECVFVEFPNCVSVKTQRSFKWFPTYKQLDEIKKALDNIEIESWREKKQNG